MAAHEESYHFQDEFSDLSFKFRNNLLVSEILKVFKSNTENTEEK